jgi:hypothetical protein
VDPNTAENLDQSYQVLASAMGMLKTRHLDAVLHTGDLVETQFTPTEQKYRELFDRASALLNSAGVPWYLTPGDHDVNPPGDFTPNSSNKTFQNFFRTVYRVNGREVPECLCYSFNVGEFHFAAVNSLEHLRTDPRWGDVYYSGLSDRQFEWLTQDLDRHARSETVVFMHQPLWYNWTAWARVHALLRRHRVRVVIAGHFHYNQDEGSLDGIHYLVVGGTGGDVKQGNEAAGNVQHVTVMTLERGSPPRFEATSVSGQAIKFAAREDADRVQALDVMLSNNYGKSFSSFPEQNPLCVIDGKLYANAKKDPPKLRVMGIANPMDASLDVAVAPQPGPLAVRNPTFTVGPVGCERVSPQQVCTMRGGTGIAYSNNSAVLLLQGLPAIWQADVTAESPAPGMTVRLILRTAFEGRTGRYELVRNLESKVAPSCAP